MQLQSLLNFAQELGDVEPLHTTVIQQLPGTQVNVLFRRFDVLPVQVVEDGSVLLVNPLHFVYMFCNPFHAFESFCEVVVLLCDGVREVLKLLQQERVLEDPLDGLDEVRLQGKAVLPFRVPRLQEVGQGRVAFAHSAFSGVQDFLSFGMTGTEGTV